MSAGRVPVELGIRRLPHGRDLPPPRRASSGASGFDLAAALAEPLTLSAGSRAVVPCGLILEIPPGWEGQVRPRSGLAARHGVTVLNAPGTIDSDYRGEVKVILVNHGGDDFVVRRGDRIAQLVLCEVAPEVELREVESLSDTERGGGGFGSTGVAGG